MKTAQGPQPHRRPLNLAALGDIILAGAVRAGNNPLFDQIRAADLACGNLEYVLTDGAQAADKLITLKAPPATARNLAAMGIDVLSLANNHAMDFGPAGLADSLAAVAAAGMTPVGAGASLDDSLAPHFREVEGWRVAFIGVSTHLPNGNAAGPLRPGVAPVRIRNSYLLDPVTLAEVPGMAPFVATEMVEEDRERLCAIVAAAAAESDLVIVNVHWGVPLGWVATHQPEIAQYQRPLAEALVEAGAGAIIGHGPHVIQPVAFHLGAPILYSVGNFIMHDILPATAGATGAYPAYDWDSLRTEWNAIGCIARLDWDAGGTLERCDLLVTRLDALGESHAASRGDAERLASRLAAAGTTGRLRQVDGHWTLSFAPAP